MSIRILTKNAVENTNIDGARQNHFNSGMQSGVVKGAFNEGNIFSPALNAIAIDSCELRISGHQIVIDSAEYITLNDKPYDAKRLSLIAQIKVTEFSEPEFEFIVQAENVKLIQDNLFENERGNGIYQLKLCNFTLGTDGVIRNVIRVVETITGGTNSAVKTDIEFTATATELSASSQPEAVITYNHETGTYDLVFGIPRGGGTDVQVGGISQGILKFDSDPQQQLDTLNAKIGTASSFRVEIVDELPTENISTSTFYLIKSKTSGENIYNEYLYVNGVWEALGTTSIEAYDDTELRRLIESKADKSALENLSNLVANKVDTTTFNTETARLQGGIKDNADEIIEIQNAGYITKEVNNLTNYTKSSELSKVATSNDYNDLDNKPTIPTKLPTPNKLTLKVDGVTKAEFDGSSAEIVNIEIPSTDAVIDIVNQHSESINEINTELAGKANKSEIPSISGLASESYVNTQINTLQGKIDAKVDKTTKINSKPLSGNITLTASDVGALPNTTTIPKLYNDFGENTDGAVTQGAITPVLASFEGSINEFYGAFEELGGILDAKYEKPSTGIPKTDLASDVQTSLGKADTALQSIPAEYITETELNTKGYATTTDVSGKLDKVTNSTTPQVYGVDALGSQTMYELSNTVRNGGLVSRFGEQILVPTTPTQDQSATSKSYVDKVDGEIYSHINSEIERVEGLIANAGGTVVTVGGTNKPVTTLNFDSNPQTQITNLETSLYNTKVILESNVSTNASDIDKLETSVSNLQNNKADKTEIPTDYVRNETYTSGLNTKADKTTVSQISNPNLLINGDFRINQRGKTTYSSSGYTLDRWKNENNYGTLTKSSNYITFSASGGTAYLVQRIEDSGNLTGKTVTLSVCLEDGTIHSATEVLQTVVNSYAKTNFSWGSVRIYYYSSGYFAPTIDVTSGNSVSVKWIKLELGSVATPYSIRPYAEELAMCQRYYQKFSASKAIFISTGIASNTTTVYIPFTYQRMRAVTPTISYSGCDVYGNGTGYTISGVSIYSVTSEGNGLLLSVTTSGITKGYPYFFRVGANGYLTIDADI